MKKWENRIEEIPTVAASKDTTELIMVLDIAGQDGWELVTINWAIGRAIFKREKEK